MTDPAGARGPENPTDAGCHPTPDAVGQPSDPARAATGQATSRAGSGGVGAIARVGSTRTVC
jgi:hypothetical protein